MKNYLREMGDSGYKAEKIDDFHYLSLPYLGDKFFASKSSKILDVGAGFGHCLFPLKKAGWRNLWAADIDGFNKNLFLSNDIGFEAVDVESGKFPYPSGYFDVVLSFHLIEHLSTPANYLEETSRVLRKEGILLIVTPDWRKQYKTFWRDHTHVHPYDKESVNRLVKSFGFSPISTSSFGVLRGLGRMGLWKFIKPLMFTGADLISVSRKT